MKLARPARPLPAVSIIPLIDVLMILLFFFIVTSSFLDLDMIPLVDTQERVAAPGPAGDARSLLVRLLPDGGVAAAGASAPPEGVEGFLAARGDGLATTRLLLLASPQADVQALVRVLDAAASLGIGDVRVVRFGPAP